MRELARAIQNALPAHGEGARLIVAIENAMIATEDHPEEVEEEGGFWGVVKKEWIETANWGKEEIEESASDIRGL